MHLLLVLIIKKTLFGCRGTCIKIFKKKYYYMYSSRIVGVHVLTPNPLYFHNQFY